MRAALALSRKANVAVRLSLAMSEVCCKWRSDSLRTDKNVSTNDMTAEIKRAMAALAPSSTTSLRRMERLLNFMVVDLSHFATRICSLKTCGSTTGSSTIAGQRQRDPMELLPGSVASECT